MNSALRFARRYGINVIPLKPRSKEPAVAWKEAQNEHFDTRELQNYVERGYNFAYVCGAVSGNLTVIDFDDYELFKRFFSKEPDTTIVRTSRGVHVYFRTEKPVKTFNIRDSEGREVITVKGEGSYVVAVGSTHPSGVKYEFIKDAEPARISGDFRQEIIQRAEELGLKPPSEKVDIEAILKGVPEGARDDSLTRLIHFLRRSGESKEEALKICLAWNRRNKPPLSDEHVRKKVDYHYDRRPEPYRYWFKQDPGKYKITADLKLKRKGKQNERDGEPFKFVAKEWAEKILEKYHFACIDDSEELYVYQDGVYVPGEALVKAEAQELLGENTSRHRINEIVSYIKIASYVKRDDFDKDKSLINVKNGLLNIFTRELKPHTPDYLSLVRIPVTYNPSADCPNIKKFLSEVLHEDDIQVVQEMVGYCLLKDHRFHKAFMLVGSGANGKSTFLTLLKEFLGHENVVSVPLQELGENRFATAALFGKLANIYADLPSRKILDSGMFKIITGGDSVYAERKFQNPFKFVNFSKQIFSANKVPEVNDDSDAFFRRWIIINFPNTFEGDKADPKIIEKLTTQEELSGFLNWALDGLERLLKNGRFSDGLTTDQVREEYLRKSDPVAAFVMDCIEIDANAWVEKDVLYNAFVEYCKANKLPTVSKVAFARDHLPRHVPNLSVVRKGPRGNRVMAWQGIRLIADFRDENRDGVKDTNLILDTTLDTCKNVHNRVKDVDSTLDTKNRDSVKGVKDVFHLIATCEKITGGNENITENCYNSNGSNHVEKKLIESLTPLTPGEARSFLEAFDLCRWHAWGSDKYRCDLDQWEHAKRQMCGHIPAARQVEVEESLGIREIGTKVEIPSTSLELLKEIAAGGGGKK